MSRKIGISLFLLLTVSLACQQKRVMTAEIPQDPHQPYDFEGKKGMVVAAHPLAAQAGLEMLKAGGNAVDAAVATALALNAAEPFASGIGGGGFMVIFLASEKRVTVVNFRERAPLAASPEMFQQEGKASQELKTVQGLSVAVPGALAGWSYALKKYGTKSWAEVTKAGIEIAEKGFLVSRTFSKINKDEYEKLIKNSGETSCYLNQGLPYEPGDTFRNPELAETFRLLAEKGIEEFYRGELAKKIIQAVGEKSGILTLEDLALYEPLEQSPLQGSYKGYTLYTLQPPGSGGLHILQLLGIAENWEVSEWGHNSSAYLHHLSEAFRFAFADRERFLGDPRFVTVPVEQLVSKKYAAFIASRIQPDRPLAFYPAGAFEDQPENGESTTQVCVADQEGNAVSLTQSINHFFGSGIVPSKTGFLLNNHMDDFSSDPQSPNAPGPQKQPVSSMGPLIMFKGKKPFLILGSPGGTRIFPTLTQIILNIIDFRMPLDKAIEAPRFFSSSLQGQAQPISLESRIPQSVIQALERIGHQVKVREAHDHYFGGAQGIMILKRVILGGADSRRDGYGAGY